MDFKVSKSFDKFGISSVAFEKIAHAIIAVRVSMPYRPWPLGQEISMVHCVPCTWRGNSIVGKIYFHTNDFREVFPIPSE